MKQVWKRRAVAAAVVVLVGTSVYLNWRYAGDVADTSKVLGQSTLVNGETAEAQADTADTAGDDYFSTARLSRKQAAIPPSVCWRRPRARRTPQRR